MVGVVYIGVGSGQGGQVRLWRYIGVLANLAGSCVTIASVTISTSRQGLSTSGD